MAFCTKCGKQNPDSAKFCTSCGATLKSTVPLETSNSKRNKLTLVVIALFLCLGIVAYFIFFAKKSKKGDPEQVSNNTKVSDLKNIDINSPSTMSGNNSYTDINGKFVYRSDCFVIITGSYSEEVNAINAVSSMKGSGYANAGYFWRPDFPSVNDKYLYSTFIRQYQTYEECEKDLRVFKQTNAYWYGIKISYDNTRVEIR